MFSPRFRISTAVRRRLSVLLGFLGGAYLLSAFFVLSQFAGNARFPAACALVFGSAVQRGGEAGPGIERRTDAAVRLWREGNVQLLIFTGGLGEGNMLSEARAMQNEALRLGLPPEVMRLEEGATSTWQNLQFARPLLKDCASVVAVSDRYHLARIRLTAWRQGTSLTLFPAAPPGNAAFEGIAVLREALGILVYLGRSAL